MKKLFRNDKFFFAMVLCAVIGEGVYCIFALIQNFTIMFNTYISMFVRILCVIFMYSAYRKHSKNVMKGLVGAMLMAFLLDEISLLTIMTTSISKVCIPFGVLLAVLLFINHFVINSDHHSSPARVHGNQIIVLLLAINGIVWTISALPSLVGNFTMLACTILDIIGFIGYICVIVCVESQLDAYRLDRESAGWTEEKGYPEGYVHEFEKK